MVAKSKKIEEPKDYKSVSERVILGIDPGSNIMGYAVIKVVDNKEVSLVVMGIIGMRKYANHYLKLEKVYSRTMAVIEAYNPDEFAIEAPFCGKNVQSMLKLGRAQGVAIAAALNRQIPITEYAPTAVKQMITGQGGAAKELVAQYMERVLPHQQYNPQTLDATDALSIAYAHFIATSNSVKNEIKATMKQVKTKTTKVSWEEYIKKNPNQVV